MSGPLTAPGDVRGQDAGPGVLARSLRWFLPMWAALCAAVALESLRWPPTRDVPLMEYVSGLVRQGAVPYRDVFEMNLPGTYVTHIIGQSLLGSGALHVRVFDLLVLGVAVAGMYRMTRSFGLIAARCSALLLVFSYLVIGGPDQALQRDWLMAVASLWALQLALGSVEVATASRWRPVRLAGSGALVGYATMVKPIGALVLFVVLAVVLSRASDHSRDDDGPRRSSRWRRAAVAVWTSRRDLAVVLVGFAVVVAGLLGWVAVSGGWADFAWMWSNYSPLYSQLNATGIEVNSASGHIDALVRGFGGNIARTPWLYVPSIGVLALVVRGRTPVARRRLRALGLLMAVGAVSLIATPRVWDYYWWPLNVAGIALLGVLVEDVAQRSQGDQRSWRIGSRVVATFAIVVLVVTVAALASPWDQRPAVRDHEDAVAEVTNAIEARRSSGDQVQVLDTAAGGVRIALDAEIDPATSFIYDFHFFHHVDSPVVRTLRNRLMTELDRSDPRFVIVAKWGWSHRKSVEDFASFPELDRFLERYDEVLSNKDFILLQRR